MQFEECFAFIGLFKYFDKGSSAFFSCALTVNVIGLLSSFHATVFYGASAFNGDLNQWDVAEVTIMSGSKSIRILEKDFDVTCTHAIAIGGFSVDVM
jgi:surface protein